MQLSNLLSDEATLAELGERLAQRRLDRQLTQANLADQAGVSKRTVERLEAGASTQLSSLIRILRVLDLLANLEQLVPVSKPSPLDLLKRKGKLRQRAVSANANESEEIWSWDDKA